MAQRDDGLDKLESFIALLGETQANFQTNADKCDKAEDALHKHEDAWEETLGELRQDVEQFNEAFTTDYKAALGGMTTISESIDEVLIKGLDDAIETIGDIQEAVENAAEQFGKLIQETFDGLAEDGYEAASKGVEDVEGLIENLENEAKNAFGELESTVEGLRRAAETARNEAFDTFKEVGENVTQTLTNAVDNGFEAFTGGLTAGGQSIVSGLGDVTNLLTEAFDLFNGGAEQIGEMLMEMGKNILTDTLNHMKDELMQQMEDAFKEMVEEFMKALVAEIIESIGMMAAGSAVTGALGAYAPALAVAKRVVGTINDLLDMLSFGF